MKKKLVPILPDPKDVDLKIDTSSIPPETEYCLAKATLELYFRISKDPVLRAKRDEYKKKMKEGATA